MKVNNRVNPHKSTNRQNVFDDGLLDSFTMPTIILKKTFKIKSGHVASEKAFSFHGDVSQTIIDAVNRVLNRIRVSPGCTTPVFKMDAHGHYYAAINHESQKHHEEDFVVVIFDVMETLGYTFRFQYDTSMESAHFGGASKTNREMFVFQKELIHATLVPLNSSKNAETEI